MTMTPERWAEVRKRQQAFRTLLPRLDKGDDLHREAAGEIRRLRKEVDEEIREAERGARDAYTAGRWDGREDAEDL